MTMRILCLTTDAYSGRGGIALYNRDMIDTLASFDDVTEVSVVPRNMTDDSFSLPDKVNYLDSAAGGKLRYVLELARLIWKRPKYDLVICSHINLLPFANIASKWLRAPLILFIYGIDAWHRHHNRYVNKHIHEVDGVVSISEITKKKFMSWSGYPASSIYILPNAIHLDKYGIADKNPSLLDRYRLQGKKVLMTLGRLSSSERYKGIDQTLEILPDLVRDDDSIVYLVAGDGDDRKRLEQKAVSLGISRHVIFTGYISDEEKADHYRLADIYVMPSKGEGFGFVFLEAMACGIPVIASNRDGGREAVRNGKLGTIVDPDDLAAYTGKIRAILNLHQKSVPEGLDYYNADNFRKRLKNIMISAGVMRK